MVSTLNAPDEVGRRSTSQREPQRGAGAISNFFSRLSTDQSSLRAKNTSSSLNSYAGSSRRSSSKTDVRSQFHSVEDGDDGAEVADPPSPSKAPRLYTSFSAAAAAASRSSLNKRHSQTSLPYNAPTSPTMRNSPSISSPRVSTSAYGDMSSSSSGAAASNLASPSAAGKANDFDPASANQYIPGSLAKTFPWLSGNLPSASRQLNDENSVSPTPQTRLAAHKTTDSPPIAQYSKGKGFGFNPHEDSRPPKSASKVRAAPSAAKMDMHDSRDSVGRGLGFKSSSELDLPERMRGRRKGAPAPPRLSQDPIAISIEEELRPAPGAATKNDSAFARLGRAFRRKSKTGSDLRVGLNADARNAPPVPKTPRRMPSQALQPDHFAVKALNASSGFSSSLALHGHRGSVDVKGKQREVSDADAEVQRRGASFSTENPETALLSTAGQNSLAHTMDDRLVSDRSAKPLSSTGNEEIDHGADKEQGKVVAKDFAPESTSKGETEVTSTDDDSAVLLTTDQSDVLARCVADLPHHPAAIIPSQRPTSMESTTSSARRRSMAFLASAISMGAIAGEDDPTTGQPGLTEEGDEAPSKPEEEGPDKLAVEETASSFQQTSETDTVSMSRADSIGLRPEHLAAKELAKAANAPSMSRDAGSASSDRRRLEPKSATRDDHVPSILSDFLKMDANLTANETKRGKDKASAKLGLDVGSTLMDPAGSTSTTMERSISGNSDSDKQSSSASPKATRAAKGVYMAPPAGPSMAGFVSPFYVAPLTSVDSGLANRAPRPSGRRASASSKSIHSDDSKSVHSGPRRGSAPLSVNGDASREDQAVSTPENATGNEAGQGRQTTHAEKARKAKSFGNLRSTAQGQSQAALSRSDTSKSSHSSRPRDASAAELDQKEMDTTNRKAQGAQREVGISRTQSVSQRFLRRPNTSGAEAGLGGERSADSEASAGTGPGRASLDDSGRLLKPYTSSPIEADDEMVASREKAFASSKTQSGVHKGQEGATGPRTSISDRRGSSALGRRPSETSNGAITPSSSRLESSGGAAALFGNPATRPRTSSLLPSFGFNRSRTGSSAGLEGSGKSPGGFGSNSRSSSSGFWREPVDPFTSSARSGAMEDGGRRSPRASTSTRPSISRQVSSSTALSEAEAKQVSVSSEKKFSMSAFLPYDDEEAPEYAERIASTAPKSQIAAILASSADPFYVEALHHFMTRFWFNGLPLDIALRKLLMDLHLPKETQQIDRVMEAFAKRYNECNSGLFASDDQPYILAFSLMMLHTDAFNKNAKNKMTKEGYLRNTGSSGVPTEILEYLYDNLTFTQFIYVEDEDGVRRFPSEASGLTGSVSGVPSSLVPPGSAANRTKIDPYFLITQGRLGELRPDLEHLIPEDTPFSYTGTLPNFDVDRLNAAFLHAPSIEIVTTKGSSEQPGAPMPLAGDEEVVSLKVTKVGIVNRKDDVADGGKKSASRKWKTSGLLLTGSQLLLFKDIVWINALQSQILDQVGQSLVCNGIPTDNDMDHEVVEGGVVISPRITYFRPDGVISLADAVAVKDQSYDKYDHVFRLVAAKGRQYLIQAQSDDDMNDWIHKINFCASFRTSNIKIRGLDLAPRVGPGQASHELDTVDALDGRLARAVISRQSFSDADLSDELGDSSRDGTQRSSAEPLARNSESEGLPCPHSSASRRLSPASSALQKRAKARRELMLTKIAETEVQLERATARLEDEIRLARHFAILTPFLKTTRDRIEMSALPLASRIRAHRLEVARAASRCRILKLDLSAGERVARALLPNTYLSSSAMRAANRAPSAQVGTPQLLELGTISDSQAQFEELFAAVGGNSNGSMASDAPLTGTVNKPATHQRNQMNLNAVTEQPADESPVMTSRRLLPDVDADRAVVDMQHGGDKKKASDRAESPSQSVASQSSDEKQKEGAPKTRHATTSEEVPEDWDQSQVARSGTNRISLVDLPSPDELKEATGGRFRFD